jgi:secondary thiamine-phosphate synthase enzyme
MRIIQKEVPLTPRPRGFHIITDEIMNHLPELSSVKSGIAHIFIKHTSASLSVNERADPAVRSDMETHFNIMVPEDADYYRHTDEGPDDMTSHIKASLLGSSVTIPVTNGKFNLGTWQGIYLCEHRNSGGIRRLTVTITGE